MAEQSFHTPGRLELDIRIPAGDVDVETVDGETSVVAVDGNEKLAETTEVVLHRNRLTIRSRNRHGFWDLFNLGGGRLTVHARVPHGTTSTVGTSGAEVRLRGRFAVVDVKTASGDIELDGETEGDARIKTASGTVRLGRIGGNLNAGIVSGDLVVGPVQGSVKAKTVSGGIQIESVRVGDANCTSVSGNIEIGVAPGSLLDVDAVSLSGTLTSDVPLGNDRPDTGEGPTLVLRGKTVSGNFKIVRAA